jgi:hypothetical protein
MNGLPTGNYTIYTYPPYGSDLSGNSTNVSIYLGETVTANIILHIGGIITGNVTSINGTAVANAYVSLSGPGNGSTFTDLNGNYKMNGLPTGNYTIYTYPPYGSDLASNSTDISVRFGETSIANIILHSFATQTTEPLVSGYNLITLGIIPVPTIYAKNLLYTTTGGIPGVTKVMRWNPNAQQWEGYEYIVANGIYLGNNFALEVNHGYFIKGNASTVGQTYTFRGRR